MTSGILVDIDEETRAIRRVAKYLAKLPAPSRQRVMAAVALLIGEGDAGLEPVATDGDGGLG